MFNNQISQHTAHLSPVGDMYEVHRPGTILRSKYRIDSVIARGAMGIVYKVFDTELGHSWALKQCLFGFETRETLMYFKNEVRLLSSLSHPSIPKIIDYFCEAGRCIDMRTILWVCCWHQEFTEAFCCM